MVENSANKGSKRTTSEKPGQEDSTWIKWVKEKSIAMNKRFRRTSPDFFKNLKKRKKIILNKKI